MKVIVVSIWSILFGNIMGYVSASVGGTEYIVSQASLFGLIIGLIGSFLITYISEK